MSNRICELLRDVYNESMFFNVFCDLTMLLSNFIVNLFWLYLYRLLFKRSMEGRRSQGRGTTRGRGSSRGRGG